MHWFKGTGRRWVLPAAVLALLAFASFGVAARGQVTLADEPFNAGQLAIGLVVIISLGVVAFVVLFLFGSSERGARRDRKKESLLTSILRLVIIVSLLWVIAANWDKFRSDEATGPEGTGTGAEDTGGSLDLPFWSWPIALATALLIAVIAVAVVLAARRAPTPTGVGTNESEQAEEVRRVLAAGRHVLGESGDARDRVLRAYAAMETALGRAGVARRIADTPAELLARAAVGDLFGPEAARAADRLAELFREARYSERDLHESAPDEAAEALATLEDDLGERVKHR